MVNPITNFLGKVQWIFAISLVLVFVTWIFALIVGEDGRELFNAAYTLTATEIIVPTAVAIVLVCLACNIGMPILIDIMEFLMELIIGGASGATGIFGVDIALTNPFATATWTPLVPDTYVSILKDLLTAMQSMMLGETPTETALILTKNVIKTVILVVT